MSTLVCGQRAFLDIAKGARDFNSGLSSACSGLRFKPSGTLELVKLMLLMGANRCNFCGHPPAEHLHFAI